jgi:hypothetical protein
MTAFLYRAPSGVAGDVTRQQDTVVESGILNASAAPTAFGVPLKIVSGKFEKIASGDDAADFAGILGRIAPSIAGDTAETFASGTPNTESIQGIIVAGYVNVKCTVGAPARGGAVYMRVVAASGKAIGDLEASSDSNNSVALTGVTWAVDGKDASNVAEIRIA